MFPPGTVDRWEKMREYLHIHAHTEWMRTEKDVIAKVNSEKKVDQTLVAHKESEDAFGQFEKTKKDRSRPSEYDPSERVASGPAPWSQEEQKSLEAAMKTVGKPYDWDKVAELVEGRDAKECKARFKDLALAAKAKK